MNKIKKTPENGSQEPITLKGSIPGVYQTPRRNITDEDSREICRKLHDERFSNLYKTEGTRHGNGLIPIDINDFFDETPKS